MRRSHSRERVRWCFGLGVRPGTGQVLAALRLGALFAEGGALLGSRLQRLGLSILIDRLRRQSRLRRRRLRRGTRARWRRRRELWRRLLVSGRRRRARRFLSDHLAALQRARELVAQAFAQHPLRATGGRDGAFLARVAAQQIDEPSAVSRVEPVPGAAELEGDLAIRLLLLRAHAPPQSVAHELHLPKPESD